MRQRWLGVLLQQVVVLLLLMHLIRLVLVQRRWRRKLLRVLPKMLMVGVLLKLLKLRRRRRRRRCRWRWWLSKRLYRSDLGPARHLVLREWVDGIVWCEATRHVLHRMHSERTRSRSVIAGQTARVGCC